MKGDEGPYMNEEGDVWVPRTVPYLRARQIAKSGGYSELGDRLVYVGKADAMLFGFKRECFCDYTCEKQSAAEEAGESDDLCLVPAWHFRLEER